jgi:alpha-beta hydrolase superfamily lysophospholipase
MSRQTPLTEVLSVALGCLSLSAVPVVAAPSADAPAYAVSDDTWRDAARQRDIPIRLYLPTDGTKAAPAILVSHGLGDSRQAMAFACREWATRGFIVVALQHPGSDENVWRNAGPADAFTAVLRAASAEQFGERCKDVKFALDELERRHAGAGRLAKRIDLDRLAIAGHSFGSLTAQAVIGQRYAPQPGLPATFKDDRIKAAVLMSPGIEGVKDFDTAFADVRVPVFHFTGTADAVAGLGVTTPSKRRVPFDRMIASDQYLVIFDRGDHIVFSGHRPHGVNEERYELIERATAQLSADFFVAYLKDEPAARAAITRDAVALGNAAKFEEKSPTRALGGG